MPAIGGKKIFGQYLPEPMLEPIAGSSVVVIQPGSYNLRIGRATDALPTVVPHCIARRHKHPEQQQQHEDSWMLRPECLHEDTNFMHTVGLRMAEDALQSRPMRHGDYRPPVSAFQLAGLNADLRPEKTTIKSKCSWSSTQWDPRLLVGKDALYISPKAPYNLHWPIRRGRLNLHSGASGSLSSVIQDLEDIWCSVIQNQLHIPLKELKNCRAILLIPDIYCRQHVRELMNLLLCRMGFAAAILVQESVCATFGTGVTSACVVDVGDQKTSICCVEDGISQKHTSLTMDFGGSDITRCFHWLLTRIGFPYKECSLSRRMDALFMQDLKEKYCHLDHERCGSEQLHLEYHHPDQPLVKLSVHAGDERLLAPLAVFYPSLYGLQGGEKLCHQAEKYMSDPTDPMDEDYLELTMSRHEQAARLVAARKRETAELMNKTGDQSTLEDADLEDDDTMDTTEASIDLCGVGGSRPGSVMKREEEEEEGGVDLSQGLRGIDHAVLQSIDKCETDDMKLRMYSCVVVVGGGLMFDGAQGWLRHLIWSQIPPTTRILIENMEIITQLKDLEPSSACWKGGAVMAQMDTTQELWIQQKEWKSLGVRVLRERAMFIW